MRLCYDNSKIERTVPDEHIGRADIHMKLEEELRLSFYQEIASVNERHGVKLVQHTDTGKVYVMKTLSHYDRTVFDLIQENHYPGVPVIKELIEADDSLIVIEDYISGHSVEELLERKTFTERETIEVISELCDILLPFHSNTPQIIHRDIKASNVIIDNERKVYLIDFDASKIVVQGRNRDTDLLGTEEYAAPEQYGFGQSDQRTDIYALGVLMNKMLTGKFPSEILYDGELAQVIKTATAIDPENRYQNVQGLKYALSNYDRSEESEVEVEVYTDYPPESSGVLERIVSYIPYPIRALPGFRSGRLPYICLALACYGMLIALGFFGVSTNPKYTPEQNRFYDIATFLIIIVPTLYIGNYLGIRDRLPWAKSNKKAIEVVRIIIGTAFSIIIVFLILLIAALILDM